MSHSPISYKRHRFPPEIIAHAVWLYVRLNLSLREVEEMLLECGVEVSYETVRRWMLKFGPESARNVRRREARPGDVWYLDEVRLVIAGRMFWLWRAVDREGVVLYEVLRSRRDKRAAIRLLKALIKRHGLPRRIVMDKLRSSGAAKRRRALGLEHRSHKGLNNRAENSHPPFRKRERCMQGFRSPGGLQRYVSCHSAVRNRFAVPARRRSENQIRSHRLEAFDTWKCAAGVA
ncbi:MAG: IS6 family transposase [Pseudomonadota bacterium]